MFEWRQILAWILYSHTKDGTTKWGMYMKLCATRADDNNASLRVTEPASRDRHEANRHDDSEMLWLCYKQKLIMRWLYLSLLIVDVYSNISTCRAASVVIAAERMSNTSELRSPSFLLMVYPVKGHVGMEPVSAIIDPL